jgi:hypothetical protein
MQLLSLAKKKKLHTEDFKVKNGGFVRGQGKAMRGGGCAMKGKRK